MRNCFEGGGIEESKNEQDVNSYTIRNSNAVEIILIAKLVTFQEDDSINPFNNDVEVVLNLKGIRDV